MRYEPESAARICYAALRQLREEQGLAKGPVWELLVREERGWAVEAVRCAHIGLPPRRVFEAWRNDLEGDGWKGAADVDHGKRTHPHLCEWEDLDQRVRDQFVLLQLMAVGMAVSMELSPVAGCLSRVTAL